MKILAFAATSSKTSINKSLLAYSEKLIKELNPSIEFELIDINDYEMPLFSVDREEELGHPQEAKDFLAKIQSADAVVISFAEHNGSYTAAYKNLFDWTSRVQQKVYQDKKAILLATSPGPGGAQTVLGTATGSMPYFGAEVLGSLSIPSFYDNFDLETNTVSNSETNEQLVDLISNL